MNSGALAFTSTRILFTVRYVSLHYVFFLLFHSTPQTPTPHPWPMSSISDSAEKTVCCSGSSCNILFGSAHSFTRGRYPTILPIKYYFKTYICIIMYHLPILFLNESSAQMSKVSSQEPLIWIIPSRTFFGNDIKL